MAAGVVFSDGAGRVLLCEPTYKDYWEFPGGAVEAGESPKAAALREVREELGLEVVLGRVLVIDWVPPRPGRTEGVALLFDGGGLSSSQVTGIRLPPGELRSWAWCTPAEAQERLSSLLARRLEAACGVLRDGGMVYLEDGCVV